MLSVPSKASTAITVPSAVTTDWPTSRRAIWAMRVPNASWSSPTPQLQPVMQPGEARCSSRKTRVEHADAHLLDLGGDGAEDRLGVAFLQRRHERDELQVGHHAREGLRGVTWPVMAPGRRRVP
jgi:hypothetical protein